MANVLVLNVLGGLYLTGGEQPLNGSATQPRRLAVLALLAVARNRGVPRERIRDFLWPDVDEDRGRHALAQSLYSLRRDLGIEALFLGQQELRLNPLHLTSDYATFCDAVKAGEPARAVASYAGPFLQGFHLPEADNFERWADEQREALAHDHGRMLEAAARDAMQGGNVPLAVDMLRRRAAQDPCNSKVAVRLMEALAADGAVVEALQHARTHERILNEELQLPPDPQVAALAARLRAMPRPVAAAPAPAGPPSSPAVEAVEAAPVATPALSLQWPWLVAALVILVLGAWAGWPRNGPAPGARAPSVIAIGTIADYRGRHSAALGPPLADMLAINLARGSGYRVISNARMLELQQQLEGTTDSASLLRAAAMRAGAAELIDGALYTIAPNRYRLDLRRVDLGSSAVVRAYRVEGADLFALVDSCVTGLVPDLGGTPPAGSMAQASTASLAAYQLYEEGLRRFLEGDMPTAERRFQQALAIDSSFAQAAYYHAVSTTSGSRSETLARLRHAVHLSRHAGDRERLIIQAEWAAQNTSPALSAIAETLMVRYPEEIDGYYFAGVAANMLGEYEKAEAPLRRVIELDSLGYRSANGGRCRICEAWSGLGHSYGAIDSLERLAALVHEWVRRYPAQAQAWRALASLYAQEGEADSALRALAVADSIEPTNPWNRRYLISVYAVLERYAEAEQLIRSEMRAAPLTYRAQAKWDLAVILRQGGRLREALALAQAYRRDIREELPPGAAPYNALHEGQVLFELGRYAAAAALFDSIALGRARGTDPSFRARDQVWAWVHEADALAKLGDTARLRFLADSMEILGRGVAQARDRRLHAHVRGLLAQLQGQDALAAEAFQRAIVSPVLGFTRSNYELGGVYLRTGRAADAVRVLRSATRGGTDGSTLYITRTEIQKRLAEAFDSAGRQDSALVYYGKVLRAWRDADPEFGPRRDSIRQAIARIQPAMPLPRPAARPAGSPQMALRIR